MENIMKNLTFLERYIYVIPLIWVIVIYLFMSKKGYQKIIALLKKGLWEIPKIIIGTFLWVVWKILLKISVKWKLLSFLFYQFADTIYKWLPKNENQNSLISKILEFMVLKPLDTFISWIAFIFLGDNRVFSIPTHWNIITLIDVFIIMGCFVAYGSKYLNNKRVKENHKILQEQKERENA